MDSKCPMKDVIRIEEQIRANKRELKALKIENMKRNARVLALEVKLMKKLKTKNSKQ